MCWGREMKDVPAVQDLTWVGLCLSVSWGGYGDINRSIIDMKPGCTVISVYLPQAVKKSIKKHKSAKF